MRLRIICSFLLLFLCGAPRALSLERPVGTQCVQRLKDSAKLLVDKVQIKKVSCTPCILFGYPLHVRKHPVFFPVHSLPLRIRLKDNINFRRFIRLNKARTKRDIFMAQPYFPRAIVISRPFRYWRVKQEWMNFSIVLCMLVYFHFLQRVS